MTIVEVSNHVFITNINLVIYIWGKYLSNVIENACK